MFRVRLECPWVDPLSVASGLKDRDGALAMIAGAGDAQAHGGRWSYVGCEPQALELIQGEDAGPLFDVLKLPQWSQGPVIGLASYDAGARPATGPRRAVWPDLILGRYPSLLVFDHQQHTLTAQGVAESECEAEVMARNAAQWLEDAVPVQWPDSPCSVWREEMSGADYGAAVSEVVRRIGEGELFQANVARGWTGELSAGRDPFDVFLRLSHQRGAAYGAFWRMGDRAIVSNSPELFLSYAPEQRRLEARPIKGTRPRSPDAAQDRALAEALSNSLKDRAENLMIVDLMRNDLARVCEVGSVVVDQLCELEHHPTVHHLTSVVSGRVAALNDVADILHATYPPGSITGAPKHQSMKVIASLEPERGVWCGSLFGAGLKTDGDMVASVLIRTASFERSQATGEALWSWRALAGAGITADSDPHEETLETEAKISALKSALMA